jgi:hypothetical protein
VIELKFEYDEPWTPTVGMRNLSEFLWTAVYPKLDPEACDLQLVSVKLFNYRFVSLNDVLREILNFDTVHASDLRLLPLEQAPDMRFYRVMQITFTTPYTLQGLM